MLTKTLALLPILATVLISSVAHCQSPVSDNDTKLSAAASQKTWPNLDRLPSIQNPKGATCGLDGAARAGTEKAKINRLRNRYHLPANGFEDFALKDLLALPQGEISPQKGLVNYPTSDNPNNTRAVTLIGYVKDVLILGCGARTLPPEIRVLSVLPYNRGVESCNCYTNEALLCSIQIVLTPSPDISGDDGHNVFVVQVTERSRRLAQQGFLSSNIGNDWKIDALKKLKNRWVRFSGWLFFNPNYRERAWVSDPEDKIGKKTKSRKKSKMLQSNVRETAWEIYPVMAIEADVTPPPM